MDIVNHTQEFSLKANKCIDHRRKYSKKFHPAHLTTVVRLISPVTDNPTTIAAAWPHGIIENTPTQSQNMFTFDCVQLVHLSYRLTEPFNTTLLDH